MAAALALVLLCAGAMATAREPAEIAGLAAPSVAHITGYMGQSGLEPHTQASGFFIHGDGFLVSVSNVFHDPETRRLCERYTLRLLDGREVSAALHALDPILNLIVLKTSEPGSYPVLPTEDTPVNPGETVIALAGSRTQGEIPFTLGSVKARHRKSVYGMGLGDMLIDTRIDLPADAYGGPLLNERGRAVGIDTPNVHRPDSLRPAPQEAHALPIRVVKSFFRVSKDLPASEQMWLGLSFRPLTPDERTLLYRTLGQNAGVYIDFVWSEGPARGSDIRAGDILVSIDGMVLRHLHQLNKVLLDAEPEALADLTLVRGAQALDRQVRMAKRPAWAGALPWHPPGPPGRRAGGDRIGASPKD